MNIKNDFFKSKSFKSIVGILSIVIAVLIVFEIGFFVGVKEASFSFKREQLGDNIRGQFDIPGDDIAAIFFPPAGFSPSHGTFGQIKDISLPVVTVVEPNKEVKAVIVESDTTIRNASSSTITATDLQIGDQVVVIGEPDPNGQVDAKLIRILPPPPNASSSNN